MERLRIGQPRIGKMPALEHVAFQTSNFGIDHAETIAWQVDDGSAANNLSALATIAISMPTSHTNDFSGNGHSGILWQNADGTPGGLDSGRQQPGLRFERRLQPGPQLA
jgi:hypothetical protein